MITREKPSPEKIAVAIDKMAERKPSKLYAIKSYGRAIKKLEELRLVGHEQMQTLRQVQKQITENYMNE